MISKRMGLAYGMPLGIALLICLWQGLEHSRARQAARSALLHRAIDISNTLGVVLRSQGVFGVVFQPRLEAALRELTKSGELKSVAVLYASGEVAASAGEPLPSGTESLPVEGVTWGPTLLTVVNPVDLGTNSRNGDAPRTSIVIPEGEQMDQFRPPHPRDDRPRDHRRDPARPPTFGRPFWMDEEKYRELVSKQGVHYFVLSLSTDAYNTAVRRDLQIRLLMAGVALVAVAGLALAWRNSERSSALRMDLLRADEMNRHLQEMNLAAAGLAHETRNPLNIIRGSSQMIARREDAPGDIRETSWRIADEVDRVTERLSQFIAYSRPAEAKLAPTDLKSVVYDAARTLESDREDKDIRFELTGADLVIQADESLLRQIVFNLLLNAIQAVPRGGKVWIQIEKGSNGTARLDVCDNGPGVPASDRENIFRPYFTASEQGTGLGLAVVRQAVLAHGWDITYVAAEEGGAVFRISGLQIVQDNTREQL